MAFSLLASVKRAGDGATSPIDTTGANLIVVSATTYAAVGEGTLSDNKSNTWLQATAVSTSNTRERIYYCANPTAGAGHTFAWNSAGNNNFVAFEVAAFSGGAASSVFDQQNGATSASATSRTTGSVTPTEDNELIVACLGFNAPNTISIDGSYSIAQQQNYAGGSNFGGALAYWIQATATATNPTFSWSSSCEAAAAIATFKAAAATTFSATAAFALGGIEIAAAAESDAPTFAASAAFALGGIDLAAAAEGPLYSATAAFALGGVDFAATGETDAAYTATAAFTLGGVNFAAIAEGPLYSASCDFQLGGIECAAEADAEEPVVAPDTSGGGYRGGGGAIGRRGRTWPTAKPAEKPAPIVRIFRAGGERIAIQPGQATMLVARTFVVAGGQVEIDGGDVEMTRGTVLDDPAFIKAMDDAIRFGGDDWEAKLSLVVARRTGGVE